MTGAVTARRCQSVSPAYVKGSPLNCHLREGHKGDHRHGPEANNIWWENTERSIAEQQREIRELSEQRRNLRGGAA